MGPNPTLVLKKGQKRSQSLKVLRRRPRKAQRISRERGLIGVSEADKTNDEETPSASANDQASGATESTAGSEDSSGEKEVPRDARHQRDEQSEKQAAEANDEHDYSEWSKAVEGFPDSDSEDESEPEKPGNDDSLMSDSKGERP